MLLSERSRLSGVHGATCKLPDSRGSEDEGCVPVRGAEPKTGSLHSWRSTKF